MTTKDQYDDWFNEQLIEQLAQSDRFKQFVNMNYDIHKVTDEDTGFPRIQVIEVPYEIAQERIKALVKEKLEDADESIVLAGADMLGKLDKINKL